MECLKLDRIAQHTVAAMIKITHHIHTLLPRHLRQVNLTVKKSILTAPSQHPKNLHWYKIFDPPPAVGLLYSWSRSAPIGNANSHSKSVLDGGKIGWFANLNSDSVLLTHRRKAWAISALWSSKVTDHQLARLLAVLCGKLCCHLRYRPLWNKTRSQRIDVTGVLERIVNDKNNLHQNSCSLNPNPSILFLIYETYINEKKVPVARNSFCFSTEPLAKRERIL